MSTRIEEASKYAIEKHGTQKYGKQPYKVHLEEVAQTVADNGGDEDQICAAWLHDVYEDTDTHREMHEKRAEVVEKFGARVDALVWACTGDGETREEKMAGVRAKLAALPDAGLDKLADRERNVNACIRDRREKLLRRYVDEHPALREVLPAGPLLELLDHKIEIAKGMLRIGLYRPAQP